LKSQRHTAKVDFLIEKGAEILWSHGYNGTSVNDIVKAAGVPKGSFYSYFESKEDFAVKSLEKYFETVHSPSIAVLNEQIISPKQRLLNFYDFRKKEIKRTLNCTKGCMACNLGNEMAEHSEKIRKIIVNAENKINLQVVKVVEEAQQNGEITSPVKAVEIVHFIEDAIKGALTSMKETQSMYPINNFYNFLAHTIFK